MLFFDKEKYRKTMQVKNIYVYTKCNNNAFPVCPRCRTPLEREYQAFCDRCGQKLGWEKYEEITPTYK